jgi:hypothetical protein
MCSKCSYGERAHSENAKIVAAARRQAETAKQQQSGSKKK